ncbi:MAG: 5'-methylthioadenosine/adenosylhomocysteine nucleosidase [Clostridia bacterium]|nr:5'-methylthioadenosine/adenosylhomocysteine nucleosidase [Clostridia bacterium]
MKKIGLLVAMEKEARDIIAGLQSIYREEYKGKNFTIGKCGGNEVVLALAGVGKVNAAYATTIMVEKYGVDVVINTGIAGGVGKLKPLSALAVSRVCQHDSDTTALGDPIGLISGLNKVYFDADKEIVDLIAKNADNAAVGCVATGDTFVADSCKAKNIAETFGAVACDMECGAVAQVCYVAGVRFGALKVISDSAEDGAEMSYVELADRACQINSSTLLKAISQL